MKHQYIFINGRAYNPATGLPVTDAEAAETTASHESKKSAKRGTHVALIHKTQASRAKTLNRRHVKHPAKTSAQAIVTRKKTIYAAATTHKNVTKFTKTTPTSTTPLKKSDNIDRKAETHPVVQRAKARTVTATLRPKAHRTQQSLDVRLMPAAPQQHTVSAPKPAAILKNEAIAEAMNREISHKKTRRTKKSRSFLGTWAQTFAVGFAVMVLGGYFTYLSMPNISIRVAALQSGVNAKYPGYRPDGYALRGPISFKSGEVSMKFTYADSDHYYTLTQQKSSWDSAAVKEFAESKGDALTTTTIDGLTIYSNDTLSTWVNGGVLYQINTHAPLSSQQIQKIATSI